ncbi:family 43 glycosylhydrolase [Massilia sp. PAMC28688]|uniref:family 43 glycosylhydrolase n=1 Tax=Massilia sp. PAMC28688 TaxID=2861283 RepID=UPI001C62DF64|nr:family 43 glycosylhydrolase [Massilia sp. PAMC28688]QYF92654.1 family 43 glycosylhydrolase [Massilia sp. PAMC28688]
MKNLVFASCLALSALPASAVNLAGLQNAHDPGTITKDGDTYFNFTTGTGIWYSTSKDLVTWTGGPAPVFGSWPAWIKTKIPDFKGSFWAPDLIHMNGYYYMYYSVSTFGTSTSAIGVARSASLKNPNWQDLGIVVESFGGRSEINAIDAALFRDHDGKVYMSYGSWFGGIGVAEINQATGKLASPVTKIWAGGHTDIEAPYIVRNGGYYYLFVNRGKCCDGVNSTYSVEVQRATSVTGPYSGTRTVMANVDGRFKGPGHVGVLKQDGCNFVSTHYYDLNDNGNAKLQFHKMSYSGDWPVLNRNFSSFAGCGGISDGLYAFKSRLNGKALTIAGASTSNGALAQQFTDNGGKHQSWYVMGHGDGYYSVINANSRRSLDNYGNSTRAGTDIAQWDYWAGAGQKWRFASPAAGYYTVANQLSGMVLDVKASNQADGAQVIQYPVNNAANQQWRLQRR